MENVRCHGEGGSFIEQGGRGGAPQRRGEAEQGNAKNPVRSCSFPGKKRIAIRRPQGI